MYDDPFITYRYAYNLSQGNGLVYNIGERSLSATSPFFVLLLAMISPIWSDFPKLANLIGAFSIAAGGIFLWDLAFTWKSPITGWLALFLFPTFPLLISTLGSEVPLYIAFCLAAFAFYARRQFALSAFAGSMATLTRPDGALILILLAIGYFVQIRRPFPWKSSVIILGVILPWFLFARIYYGSPIPLTLATKQLQGAMVISQRFAPGLATILKGYTHQPYFLVEAVLAALGFIYLALFKRRWALVVGWQILYFASYSILGVSRYFWYYAPLVPGFLILVGLGLDSLHRLIVSILEKNNYLSLASKRLPSLMAIALVVLFSLSQIWILNQLRTEPDERYPIYREAGEWLVANTPEDASVGTLETGIIGYFANRFMIDFAGLLQPDVALQLTPSATYADAAYWAVEHYQPDYLAILAGTLPALEDSYVTHQCKAVHQIPGEIHGREVKLGIFSCSYNDSFIFPAVNYVPIIVVSTTGFDFY